MEGTAAFSRVLAQADALGQEFCRNHGDRYCFPLPGTGAYRDAVSYAVLLYLSKWMRENKSGQATIYRYATEHYLHDVNEKRFMYAHERALLKQTGDFAGGESRLYDPADFHLFTNSMKGLDPLLKYAVRGTLPLSKHVDNKAFAAAYQKYDEEYERAAAITDAAEYVSVSIHLFRKEYGFAFSIIAQIAQYMKEHDLEQFDFAYGKVPIIYGVPDRVQFLVAQGTKEHEKHKRELGLGKSFWTDTLVEDLATKEQIVAPPDVIRCQSYIPMLFAKVVPDEVRFHYLRSDLAVRTLYTNIFRHLDMPGPESKPFDFGEIAEYLRENCSIIDSHVPVSFYDGDEKPDKRKIFLARKIMKQAYK